MAFLNLFFFFLCFFSVIAEDDYIAGSTSLDPQEQEALYLVLETINPQLDWRSTYPDDLCNAGPHGIVCQLDENDPTAVRNHVVEINLGWIADSSNNPPCSKNASFSPSLSNLPYLRKLLFYRCFTPTAAVTLPHFLWSLGPQLEELVLLDNPGLTGILPAELSKLIGLRRLIISGTGIGGTIPSEIKQLQRLQQLDLSNNKLNHTIPSLGTLKQLVVLDLNRNLLTGAVPADVGSLTELSNLDLSSNNLTGAIPASFAALNDLEVLDLRYNSITGGIPGFLGGLWKLKNLNLGGNPMGGFLPKSWNGLKGLIGLDLSGVGLVGEIPISMGELKNLSYLALDHNSLSGNIPTVIADLPNIHHIDLSYNRLSGLIPFSALLFERLGTELRLDGNDKLCFNPETFSTVSKRVIDIGDCSSVLLSQQSLAERTSSSSSSSRTSRHLVLSLIAIFILFLD